MTATRIDRGSTDTTAVYSDGGDLVFERTFDAPRDRVWQAFTDPELVPRWWGKHGTTTIVEEMDVRPGGKWRYVSRDPDREDVDVLRRVPRGRSAASASGGRSCSTSRASARWAAPRRTRSRTSAAGRRSLGRPDGLGRGARGRAGDAAWSRAALETWDRLAELLAEG